MIPIKYEWQGKEHELIVPNNWPYECVVQIAAFKAGANYGDVFEFIVEEETGKRHLIATGGNV